MKKSYPKVFNEEIKSFMEPLDKAKEMGVYTFSPIIEGAQTSHAYFENRDHIILTSNNYLGMANHPEVIKAVQNSLEKYGVGTCGSRMHNGTTLLHREFEDRVSEYLDTEDTVLYSAGYMANVGGLMPFGGRDTLFIVDKYNHMSLVDAYKLAESRIKIFSHNDMEKLEYILESSTEFKKKVIITDGVFSMEGDIAKLDTIAALAEKHNALLFVDDAHSFGILGEGKGTAAHFGVEKSTHLIMGTCSKALGSVGGFISGNKDACDYIRHLSHSYIFNATLPAPVVAGLIKSLELIRSETWRREKLWDNTKYFKDKLLDAGFNILNTETPIIPIHSGDKIKTMYMARELLNRGVYMGIAIFPTVPENQSRFRITVTANLEKKEIDKAFETFYKVNREFESFDAKKILEDDFVS